MHTHKFDPRRCIGSRPSVEAWALAIPSGHCYCERDGPGLWPSILGPYKSTTPWYIKAAEVALICAVAMGVMLLMSSALIGLYLLVNGGW